MVDQRPITFVIPPIVEKLWTFTYDEIYLGAAVMASQLRHDGHRVTVIDCAVDCTSMGELSRRLAADPPRVVAICAIYGTVSNVYRIARLARLQGVPRVVVGGLPASFAYETMLRECPEIDLCVVGEGEQVMGPIAAGEPTDQIPGVARLEGGQVAVAPGPPPIQNLDSLPLASRDLFPLGRYRAWSMLEHRFKGSTTVETKRGCPHDCEFCTQTPKEGRRMRLRSVQNVIDELNHLARRHPEVGRVMIVDNDFFTPLHHGRAILEGCIEAGLPRHHEYMIATRADHFFRKGGGEELIGLCERANVRLVYFGVESVNNKNRHRLGKIQDSYDMAGLFSAMQRRKVWNVGSYMLGFPNEDLEDIEQTLRASLEHRPSLVKYNIVTPYPGTRFHRQLQQDGLLLDRPLTLLDNAHATFRSSLDLERIFHKAFRRYFLSADFMRLIKPGQMMATGDTSRFRTLGHHVLRHEAYPLVRAVRRGWRRAARGDDFDL